MKLPTMLSRSTLLARAADGSINFYCEYKRMQNQMLFTLFVETTNLQIEISVAFHLAIG
jgi:hypothetical protein